MESTIRDKDAQDQPTLERDLSHITIDPHRAIVFPNRLRERRRAAGFLKLLRFAAILPEIPYIRLSKIERGEVVARADELVRIGKALGIGAADLLIDPEDAAFDLADWARPFMDAKPLDDSEERFALLLGAAVRARRSLDPDLTIAVVEQRYGLPQVNLSRIENAAKHWGRWNAAVQGALLRLFDVADEPALRRTVFDWYGEGRLDPFLAQILDVDQRRARSRARIAALAEELSGRRRQPLPLPPRRVPSARIDDTIPPVRGDALLAAPRTLPVYGAPLSDGLIDFVATADRIDAPRDVGSAAFGLRIFRATLGGGLPGHAVVVVDPGRYPTAGGLAVVREGAAWRVVAVTIDRDGVLTGYSINPAVEVTIDGRDTADVAAVVAALF